MKDSGVGTAGAAGELAANEAGSAAPAGQAGAAAAPAAAGRGPLGLIVAGLVLGAAVLWALLALRGLRVEVSELRDLVRALQMSQDKTCSSV
jgi:hypothetical protein